MTTSGTSRQLERETDALPVTAGAMYTGAVLAVLSLTFAVTAFGSFAGYKEVLARGGGAVFAEGMAKFLNVLRVPTDFGAAFASVFLCIMALTVMQLVLRFMRIASAELVGDRFPAFRNPHFGSIVGIVFTLLILWTGFWARIWILFGGSSQVFAGLALMLASIWLANQGKAHRWVAYPAAFMYITTVAALLVTGYYSLRAAFTPGLAPAFVFGNLIAGIIAFALVILAVLLAADGLRAFQRARLQPAPAA